MKPRPSAEKRRKELDRQDKKQAKLERRNQRRAEREARPRGEGEEDPDLAGIVAGPQPVVEDELAVVRPAPKSDAKSDAKA